MQLKWPAFDAAKHGGNLVGDHVVHVANEAQRQVIVFRTDPARARQSAAEHAERLPDIGWNFDTSEETRHGETFNHDARAARARVTNSSTRGRIRATIASTPAAFGCMPSP